MRIQELQELKSKLEAELEQREFLYKALAGQMVVDDANVPYTVGKQLESCAPTLENLARFRERLENVAGKLLDIETALEMADELPKWHAKQTQ